MFGESLFSLGKFVFEFFDGFIVLKVLLPELDDGFFF